MGWLTNLSQHLNRCLGDSSGCTISLRTTRGFQTICAPSMPYDTANAIVHLAMWAILVFLIISEQSRHTLLPLRCCFC